MLPPCVDSGFECEIDVIGKDDVLFILGVNSFVRENVLVIEDLSCDPSGDPKASMAAFSISQLLFLNLKLSLGRRLLIDGLALCDEGSGEVLNLISVGLGNGEKFTFLGVGDRFTFILTRSSLNSSAAILSGTSTTRFCLLL